MLDRLDIRPSRVMPRLGAYRSFDQPRSWISSTGVPDGSAWVIRSSTIPWSMTTLSSPTRRNAKTALLGSSASPRDKEAFSISTTTGVIPKRSRLAASANPAIPAPTIRIRGLAGIT